MIKEVKELIETISEISPNGLIALSLVVVLAAILSFRGSSITNRNQ